VVPFVLQIVAAVGLVGYLSFKNGQQAINDLAYQLTKEVSNRINEHVIGYLNKTHQVLRVTYDGVQGGNLNLKNFDGLQRYFWQVVREGDLESYLSFGNEQGEFVGVENREDKTVQLKIRTKATEPRRKTYLLDNLGNRAKLLQQAEYDPRERPWYQAAKQAKQPTWSPIYPFFLAKLRILLWGYLLLCRFLMSSSSYREFCVSMLLCCGLLILSATYPLVPTVRALLSSVPGI
jgi:sigma-B regulation protein RsbU (phosphoserine phosphatase)